MANIPFDGGPGIPITPKGSVEEAKRAARMVVRLAHGDVAAAAVVLVALGLDEALRGAL